MNVIKAVFGSGRFAKTAPVFQWDTGDKLQFFGISLPGNYQVHFANSFSGEAVTAVGDESGVAIPSQFIQPGTEIYAWIWLSDSDGGYTKYQVTIPIYKRAKVTGQTPTPEQQSALDDAIGRLNDAADDIPNAIETALTEAKASGEFDGADGNAVWTIDVERVRLLSGQIQFVRGNLIGPDDVEAKLGDLVIVSNGLLCVVSVASTGISLMRATIIGNLSGTPGADGYSPSVSITDIEGGHRVTITDEAHPQGQSFDVMDGQGGSGSSDYNDLSNKPSIEGVTISGNKTAAQLGLAKASDIPTVPVQSVNGKTGAVVLSASDVGAGTYTKPSGGIPKADLAAAVQTSLGKADTALQSAPVTSVNGQTGAVSLTIPSTAADVGAVTANQGIANANKVLTVNGSGIVVPEDNRFVVTLTPTAADYSGAMDKTVAEIDEAYKAGKKIVFKILSGTNYATYVDCTMQYSGSSTYPSFNGFIIFDVVTPNLLIFAYTGTTNNGTDATYYTNIYPLATGQWTGGSY